MSYGEADSVEAGLKFKSPGGLIVETTGKTSQVESNDLYVHEVKIIEGDYAGEIYLLNLDYAKLM